MVRARLRSSIDASEDDRTLILARIIAALAASAAPGCLGPVPAQRDAARPASAPPAPQPAADSPSPPSSPAPLDAKPLDGAERARGTVPLDHATAALIEIPGGLLDGVRIEPFFIDRTETTVRSYTACVERGMCGPAHTGDECSDNAPGREDYPINCVDWAQAAKYCAWEGKRLPSGLEWSWVARGREEDRPFPWGDEAPTCERLKVSFGIPRRGKPCDAYLRPVASLPANASRDGVLDMQGNVEEWAADPPRKLPRGLNEPYALAKGALRHG